MNEPASQPACLHFTPLHHYSQARQAQGMGETCLQPKELSSPETLSAAGPGELLKCQDITTGGKNALSLFASWSWRNWKKREKRCVPILKYPGFKAILLKILVTFSCLFHLSKILSVLFQNLSNHFAP